jgi:hypothetical protein
MGVLSFIAAVTDELERHTWGRFSEGGREDSTFIVMPGCPVCKKRLYTQHQFMHHLVREVFPRAVQAVIEKTKADKAERSD